MCSGIHGTHYQWFERANHIFEIMNTGTHYRWFEIINTGTHYRWFERAKHIFEIMNTIFQIYALPFQISDNVSRYSLFQIYG
jgi:hypothetical protein